MLFLVKIINKRTLVYIVFNSCLWFLYFKEDPNENPVEDNEDFNQVYKRLQDSAEHYCQVLEKVVGDLLHYGEAIRMDLNRLSDQEYERFKKQYPELIYSDPNSKEDNHIFNICEDPMIVFNNQRSYKTEKN